MLNLQKVYQRKRHLKDTNAPGTGGDLEGQLHVSATQGHELANYTDIHMRGDSPLQPCRLSLRRQSKLMQASRRRLREN